MNYHNQLAQGLQLPGQTSTIVGPLSNPLFNPTGSEITISYILSSAIPFVFAFAGIGLLVMLIFGGFDFLTSAGDAKKLESGKQKIVNAIIGFLIIFVAYWIVQALGIVFGLSSINQVFK
jgi:Type IV secretion system pilin